MSSHLPRSLALALLPLCLLPAAPPTQSLGGAQAPQVFCEPSRAIALAGEQLKEAKALSFPPRRVGVMTRAADMLWPHDEQQARAAFTEAFRVASRSFRERSGELRGEPSRATRKGRVFDTQFPDQRIVVLRALAKRDPTWARELAERAAEETRAEAKKDEAASRKRPPVRGRHPVGEKLIDFAADLVEIDPQYAYTVVRGTFADPAAMNLPYFLYRAARSDRAATDALFRGALTAYADRDINSLMHLSLYPFALVMSVGPTTSDSFAGRPAGFAADPELQGLYVNAFLGLAERRVAALARHPPAGWVPFEPTEGAVIYAALNVLETLYGAREPAALGPIRALKRRAAAVLTPEGRRNAAAYSKNDLSGQGEAPPSGVAFDAAVERAEGEPDDERYKRLAEAVLYFSSGEPLEKVEAVARKIDDEYTRLHVYLWLYFRRGQDAARSGDFEEALGIAERVEPLGERLILLLDIASEGLKHTDRQRAEEMISALVSAARRAPDSTPKARALLGAAQLYARLDYLRGLDVMGEAVAVVNKLNDPDLVSTYRHMGVYDGKGFHLYPQPGWTMANLTLESSFGELGARDFEATLAHAVRLGDRNLRAAAVLALSAKCLEEAGRSSKQ